LKEDNSQPFTVITFHQTNGGAGDDPTASQVGGAVLFIVGIYLVYEYITVWA
jgi:hypothetical protein